MTFEEYMALATGEYQAAFNKLNLALGQRDTAEAALALTRGDLTIARSDLAAASSLVVVLQGKLADCLNPPSPVVPTEIGMYSGMMPELSGREQQLGVTIPSTWFFGRLDTVMSPAWNFDRENFTLWCNVHPRIGTAHDLPNGGGSIQWKTVADTTQYDARLIAFMKSVGTLTKCRILIPVQEEMDGGDGSTHGSADEYKRFFYKVYGFAKQYCPRAEVGMDFANANRASNFVVPEVQFMASNPHFYVYDGTTGLPTKGHFVDVVKQEYDELMAVGLGTKPYFIHTGISEPMTEAQAIALGFANGAGSQPGNIVAGNVLHSDSAMKIRIVREEIKPFLTATLPWRKPDGLTIWDRSTLTNSRAADERINSSLGDNGAASLQAFKELFTV